MHCKKESCGILKIYTCMWHNVLWITALFARYIKCILCRQMDISPDVGGRKGRTWNIRGTVCDISKHNSDISKINTVTIHKSSK